MPISINVKNSLLLISEKIILLGMAFLTTILMARVAGPDLFGQYAYITSFTALFIPLCTMGLNNISTKYFVKYPKHSSHFFLTALVLRFFGAITCIIIGSISALFLDVSGEHLSYIFALLILQSFSLFYIVEYHFLAKKQVIYTLKIRLVVIIIAGLAKVVVILQGANLLVLILLNGFEFVAIGLSYLALYYKKTHNKRTTYIKPISKLTLIGLYSKGKWLLFSGIAAVVYLKIDQVMLANIVGAKEVAYYAAAVKLSEFWYVFPVLIANAYTPQLIYFKQKDNIKYQNYLLKTLALMVVIASTISLVMYSISVPLINFLYGDSYQSSASILNVHIFASIFIFQRAFFSKWIIIENHYQYSLVSTSAGAIINILLNMYLIPKHGGIGAAWATLASYIVASYLSLLFFKATRPFFILMTKAMLQWPYILFISKR